MYAYYKTVDCCLVYVITETIYNVQLHVCVLLMQNYMKKVAERQTLHQVR